MWGWLRSLVVFSPHSRLLSRYKQLRKVAIPLNHRLVETLSRSAMEEGGKKLGLLKRKTLVLDSEDEMAVLMDFCIYDVRRQGVNAVDRYLAESPPAPGSDEMVLLQAMQQARYSLFVVVERESWVGVHVRDLLRDETLFLMDVGLGSTAPIGLVLATRIVGPEGMFRTTGAALPLGVMTADEVAGFLERNLTRFTPSAGRNLSPQEASEMTASVIRTSLQRKASQHIRYAEPGSGRVPAPPDRVSTGPAPPRRLGSKQPCPCGSGKKFKRCCGRRK